MGRRDMGRTGGLGALDAGSEDLTSLVSRTGVAKAPGKCAFKSR